ncbi:MAG: acylneuraminate cytidylyltransferase family protein [Deltaproteobacteria bacterium]|nr:acylneuraminate cytidylyltransferase family protein [Deltaproteobacteria bacterium]
MSYHGFTVLAVVPARGGSKGIPRKNLQKINNISLVGRAAKIAVSIPWIDRAILSTDDAEIADEGLRYGLDVPFMRPPELAGDLSSSVEMWKHAWLKSEEHYDMKFDVSILLEPTSPLRRKEDVEKTMSALMDGDHFAAATVSKTPAHFTPHKCLTINYQGYIGFYLEQGDQFSIRQKIPTYYFRNGVCYAVKRKALVEKGHILEESCIAVLLDRPLVNIDEPFDLELAKFLIKREKSFSS